MDNDWAYMEFTSNIHNQQVQETTHYEKPSYWADTSNRSQATTIGAWETGTATWAERHATTTLTQAHML